MRLPILLCLLASLCSPSYGQEYFVLSNADQKYRLDQQVAAFIDTTQAASLEQILTPELAEKFKTRGHLIFGYLPSPVWLKINLKNNHPAANWYLEIPAPFLEYVDFYQLDSGGWQLTQAGYYRPQSLRKVPHTAHVLPLLFDENGTTTVYVKIAGNSPKTFPLFAIEKENFYKQTRKEDLFYGVFFGILVVMFFYNFFIYLSLRQTNYLIYIGTIVCTFLIFGAASGYLGRFAWPEQPLLNFYAGRLSLGVFTVFLAVFTIRFLNVRRYSKLMYYILLSLIPLGLMAIVLVATNVYSSAGNNLISLSILIYLTSGIVCRVKGNPSASFFIAAWTIYFVGGLLLTLRNSGFFDFNFWTTHFVEIGAALETIIIAFALADQYRRLRIEKEQAQQLALQLQQEVNEKLEEKVAERTEQLSKANEELQSTLETNRLQTQIIERKNIELDSFFHRVAHDLKGPVSSLLGLNAIAKAEVKDVKAIEYLDMQQRQTERLNTIIHELINLAQLGNTELKKEPIDFVKMVDECVQSFQGFPQFAKIQFKKEIDPVTFSSEWILLNTIVQNLIENAIKYSAPNDPFVSISVKQQGPTLHIKVEDNGLGIPTEHHAKIFDIFYRANKLSNGSGLGLYILKRSVDRLGGSVSFQSSAGKGSVFSVVLPLQ